MKLSGYVKKSKVAKKKLPKYEPIKESSRKDFKLNEIICDKASHIPPKKMWKKQNIEIGSVYGKFLLKYDDLDNTIDDFNAQDLLFYFREVANENGYKYMLNFSKEGAQMKRLKQTYTNREICGMIEFLYTSEQDYLIKSRLSVGLLCSGWINTIYADFQLWLDDKYVPQSKRKSHKQGDKHEWKDNNVKSKVGEW